MESRGTTTKLIYNGCFSSRETAAVVSSEIISNCTASWLLYNKAIIKRRSNMEYGYVRVSTKEQNEDRQMVAMRDFGIADGRIILDKQSGKDFDRPGYRQLMRKLKAGDTLVIKSIDRLGRNYDEILEQWRLLTKEKQVTVVVLDMPLLDTRQGRDLTGVLIADIVLQLLSYVAQTERDFNRQRQAEGIAAAKAKGIHFGRKFKDRGENYESVMAAWRRGEISGRAAAKELGVAHGTFQRWCKE